MNLNFLNQDITLAKFDDDDDCLSTIISKLPSTARVIEVGANIGKFSKLILEKFDDVLIIEGEDGNFKRLVENFPKYKDKILQLVVYKDNDEHVWYHEDNSTSNAVGLPLPTNQKLNMSKAKVFTKSLDSINHNFDFLKLDCEGADFPILLGAENLIIKNRPLIYFEHSGQIGANTHKYNKDMFFDFFDKNNYSIFLANTDPYLPAMWYTSTTDINQSYNILAVPK